MKSFYSELLSKGKLNVLSAAARLARQWGVGTWIPLLDKPDSGTRIILPHHPISED